MRHDVELDSLKERCRLLEMEQRFSQAVSGSMDLDSGLTSALDTLYNQIKDIAGIEIHFLDPGSGMLFLKGQRGLSPKYVGTGTLQIGEGPAGQVAQIGEAVFFEHLAEAEGIELQDIHHEKFAAYAGIPIRGEFLSGVLGCYFRHTKSFSEHERRFFSQIGHHLSLAVHNSQILLQSSLRERRFTAISRAITVTRRLGTIKELFLDLSRVLVQSMEFDRSWIALVDEERRRLTGIAGFGAGLNEEECRNEFMLDGSNPAVNALKGEHPAVLPFVEDVPEGNFKKWLKKSGVQSLALVPIVQEDRVVGIIGVFYLSDRSFAQEDLKTLKSIADQAAIAMENGRLYEQVKSSESQYRTLFESAGTCLAIVDDQLRFHLVNRAFETLSGFKQRELIGHRTLASFLSHKQPGEKVQMQFESVPNSWESIFIGKGGCEKRVHISAATLPGTTNLLVSLIDRTEQRELERRLYHSEELAAIGELSAGIAHEIRNPLVAITNSVSLLQEESDISGEGRQLLNVVKEESSHLAAIVDDFLKFARPQKPSFQEEDINKLMKETVRRYGNLNEKSILWKEKYDKRIPLICIDRHQIQQVITNLLINSFDAMNDEGTITLQTSYETGSPRDWIRISLSDTGIGIAEENLTKIFQPFFSLKEKGTGMGLAICQRLINNHEGEILVSSRLGEGTTFEVLLPVRHNVMERNEQGAPNE